MAKGGKAHDIAHVFHNGRVIASFGIRRGSNKNLPHPHIPDDLHLRPHDALQLANCPLSRAAWLRRLREQGWIDEDEDQGDDQSDEDEAAG